MKYSQISKGISLAADHAKYITWLTTDTAARQSSYKLIAKSTRDKHVNIAGWLIPFGINVAAKYALVHYVISENQTGASNPALATAVYNALVGRSEPSIIDPTGWTFDTKSGKKFKFAKLSVTQVTNKATTKSTSRITGRQYYKNVTSSVTAEFGQIITGESYQAATEAIVNNFTLPNLRIRFKQEGS